MKRRVALLIVLTAAMALAPGLSAYLRFGVQVGNQVILLKWAQLPVRYFITNRDVPGVAPRSSDGRRGAFAAWSNVPRAALGAVWGHRQPIRQQGRRHCDRHEFQPDLDRVLGATTHSIDSITGAIVESDIF
jgi:hypothetical protein